MLLEVLHIRFMSRSLKVLSAFASTLRHLMLSELPWRAMVSLPSSVLCLTALEVRGHYQMV